MAIFLEKWQEKLGISNSMYVALCECFCVAIRVKSISLIRLNIATGERFFLPISPFSAVGGMSMPLWWALHFVILN